MQNTTLSFEEDTDCYVTSGLLEDLQRNVSIVDMLGDEFERLLIYLYSPECRVNSHIAPDRMDPTSNTSYWEIVISERKHRERWGMVSISQDGIELWDYRQQSVILYPIEDPELLHKALDHLHSLIEEKAVLAIAHHAAKAFIDESVPSEMAAAWYQSAMRAFESRYKLCRAKLVGTS